MRTSFVLGAVAVGLLLFIVFFERSSVTSTELDERKGRVLDHLVRQRVVRVEIERKGVKTVLSRKPDPENELDLGAWTVDAPYQAKADQEVVDTLLGDLEWFDAKRVLRKVTSADRASFGLDKPRYRAAFTIGRQRIAFSVGGASPNADGIYLQLDDPSVVYVVRKDIIAALDHESEYFHTKEVHGGMSVYGAQKLTLRDQSGERVVEKRGDYFWLAKPEQALASEPTVAALISALDALRAKRFVSTSAAMAESAGLSAPSFEAVLVSRNFDAKATDEKDKFRMASLTLRVGKPCDAHPGESYLRVDEGPIMCAADADLEKLRKSATELRDARLLVLDDSQIHGVRMRSGKAELLLDESKEGVRYTLRENDKVRSVGEADAGALHAWYEALRSAQALMFSPAVAPARDEGLGADSALLSFGRGKDKPAYEIRVGHHDDGRIAVGRLDEGMVLWFPESVTELVSVSTARFRRTQLLQEPIASFARLTLRRTGAVAEVVTKDASGYHLQGPVTLEAERASVDDIVRLFSSLQALRFVAEATAPEHGLAHPERTLHIEYAPVTAVGNKPAAAGPRAHTLLLGAAADGGRYALLDQDPAVFVVASPLVDALSAPLATRAALATPIENLLALTITHAQHTVRVTRGQGGSRDVFAIDGEDDSERALRLVRALATLRASTAVAYGSPEPAFGFAHPEARIVVSVQGGALARDYTLLLGAPVDDDPHADVYARRSDLDVTWKMSRALADVLLEQTPKAAAEK